MGNDDFHILLHEIHDNLRGLCNRFFLLFVILAKSISS